MENQEQKEKFEEEIDLRDYVNVILKRKWVIIAIFLIAVIAAVIISFLMPRTYQSSALLEIGKIESNYLEKNQDIVTLFKQPTILKILTKKIGISEDQWQKLKNDIKIQPLGSDKFIEIIATANTPSKAQDTVNQTINFILERHQDILSQEKKILESETQEIKNNILIAQEKITELEKEMTHFKNAQTWGEGMVAQSYIEMLTQTRTNLALLKQQLQDKERESTYNSYETKIESPSFEPLTPITPNKKQNVIIGGILGLFIGILWAFMAEYCEKNLKKK